jgi:hypothetical protein
MFKSIWNIASAAFLLCGSTAVVHAYSSGAGQCIGGMAAVGEAHRTSTAVTGSLQDGALTVTVLRDQTDAPSEEITTDTNTTITIGFSSSDSTGFRGALIRASSTDGAEFTLEPGVNGANAMACTEDGVFGVTHSSNDLKMELGAILNVATAGTVTLDVTVVLAQNSQDGSIYYYSPITVTVVDGEPEIDTGATLAPAASTTETTSAPAASTTETTSAPATATTPETTSAPVAAEPAPAATAPSAAAEPTVASAPQNLTPKAPSGTPKPPSANKAPTKSGAVVGASAFTTTLGGIMVVVAATMTML